MTAHRSCGLERAQVVCTSYLQPNLATRISQVTKGLLREAETWQHVGKVRIPEESPEEVTGEGIPQHRRDVSTIEQPPLTTAAME